MKNTQTRGINLEAYTSLNLDKEIIHKEEKFIPIEKLRELFYETKRYKNGSSELICTLIFEDESFFIEKEDCYYTSDYHTTELENLDYKIAINIHYKLIEWGLLEIN